MNNTGFLWLPHRVGNILLVLNLKGRQLKVLWLVARLTYGCNKRYAKLLLTHFQAIGIGPTHIREVIDPLILDQYLEWKKDTEEYRINEEYLTTTFTDETTPNLKQLSSLIGMNLPKKNYQNSKPNITKKVNNELPIQEGYAYQSGKESRHKMSSMKDILNKKRKIIKESIENPYKARKDPNYFAPMNSLDSAVYEAWNTLEPENPASFDYYLSIRHAVPESIIYQFVHEIQSERKISNKGAVFVSKVNEYLKSKKAGDTVE